jgi:hypothetical protein
MSESVTREEALSVPCPACTAAVGQPCHGARGVRVALHVDRAKAFAARHGRNVVPFRRAYDDNREPNRAAHARDTMTAGELDAIRELIAQGWARLPRRGVAFRP